MLANLNVACRKFCNETEAILVRTVVRDSQRSWWKDGCRDLNEFPEGTMTGRIEDESRVEKVMKLFVVTCKIESD